ncbi:unnamed protein product [Chondrus crispus]|uniref:Uncharacterized protein n=1 Tax=Chondrus crispus TaxID=2769 RepID=R7QQP2_CHOCR|nr:unnamed protein product [Chondrus crispus]CDF40048.1 unnamed protein product [Chondrus crispus]|eukprot:XP_005710342.1 unnamed protein product [Chondrus crispus]
MGSWGALLSPLAERGGGGAQARQTHRTSFVVSTLAPTYPSRLSVSLLAVIRQLIAVDLSLEAACVTCAGQDTFPSAQCFSLTVTDAPCKDGVRNWTE